MDNFEEYLRQGEPNKTVSLDTMIDKHFGKRGTERRETFENELT